MAGRPKAGLDYAGWSVNIFDGDTKIDKLLDAQGSNGFLIYFYLCQMAYKFDGYFYRWRYDDSASTARRLGCGIGSKTVENAVGLCLQIGLFDKPLFDRHGILTSRGIQRRYLAAIQGRRVKSVISDYWLLSDGESEGLVKCAANNDLHHDNSHLQGADGHLQDADTPKSKGKESKENTPHTPRSGGKACFVPPTVEEVRAYCLERNSRISPEEFVNFYASKGWMVGKNKMKDWQAAVRTWEKRRKDEKGGDAGNDPFKDYF